MAIPAVKGAVIAVDGPAASGKGTIARALARHFGLPHMDTGLLYRAVALNLWRWGGDPGNQFEALRACDDLGFDPRDPELRSEPVSRIASMISAYPVGPRGIARAPAGFRRPARRRGARRPRHRHRHRARCRREIVRHRHAPRSAPSAASRELQGRGMTAHYEDVLADIRARDERDTRRDVAPLKQAGDAVLLDTSDARRRPGDRRGAAAGRPMAGPRSNRKQRVYRRRKFTSSPS